MKYGQVKNFIDGKEKDAHGELRKIFSPIDGSVIGETKDSTKEDIQEAVKIAKKAQKEWAALTTKARVEVHFNYRALLKQHRDELAEICHLENGKTMAEAYAGVDKAIELTDFACSMPQMISGEIQEVSRGIECRTIRKALGVVASIAPFNFPIMVPHWTVPNALAVGNAMILKPSELTPISAIRSAELWKEAGLPDGVLNVVLGAKDVVEEICDNPDIPAVTFVGSTPVAQIVYRRAANNLKKVVTFGGAKNYLVLTESAHPKSSNDIMSAFCGMAGQRCMAASVLINVGNNDEIIKDVIAQTKDMIPGKNLPPLVTKEAVEKIAAYIEKAKSLGANIILDGRDATVEGNKEGYYIGPTIIDWKGKEELMPLEEAFGPTLDILHTDNLSRAIELQNKSPYGNASTIFTQNGRVAQEAIRELEAGMLGVNIGIPVPREPFSFGGIKHSRFGQGGITGWSNVQFLTDEIKVTSKWNPEDKKDWMS